MIGVGNRVRTAFGFAALAAFTLILSPHRSHAARIETAPVRAVSAILIEPSTGQVLYEQNADLYSGSDQQRYEDSLKKASTYGTLTAVSVVAAVGLFTFSFVEMVRYFNLYGSSRTGKPR